MPLSQALTPTLYFLGNNDKKNSTCIIRTDSFFPKYFQSVVSCIHGHERHRYTGLTVLGISEKGVNFPWAVTDLELQNTSFEQEGSAMVTEGKIREKWARVNWSALPRGYL